MGIAAQIKSILGLGIDKKREIYQNKRYDIDDIMKKQDEEAKKKKESQVAQPTRPIR